MIAADMLPRSELLPADTPARRLFSALPAERAADVLAFSSALRAFAAAPSVREKEAAAEAIRRAFPALRGLSLKSLYRKAAHLRDGGLLAIADGRSLAGVERGLRFNDEFVAYWHSLCLANRRARGKRAAWSRLVRDLRAGIRIPGVGDWRDLFLAVHGVQPSPSEPCPWDESNPPPGWSYPNLARLAPKKAAKLAASVGPAAAALACGFTVSKTRVGLQCCQVVEVDDMWYEHKVVWKDNREPQRVIEFAAMDRLTGHAVTRLMKVNRERSDGSLETMKSRWARYVYHYLLCVSGIPPAGMLINGEHGTMCADDAFAKALSAVNAYRASLSLGPVAFKPGALLPRHIAKGLPDGPAKGNPRHKGMLEGFHALLKNELADVIGEVGGGRGLEPEAAASLVAESRRLSDLARVLEARRPGLAGRLRHPFLHFPDFALATEEAYRRLDTRTNHDLEGWEACGFVVREIQFAGDSAWRTLLPEKAAAAEALVAAGFASVRVRRMSPAEAWQASSSVLSPLPPCFSPVILGDDLAATATVSNSLRIDFRSPDTAEPARVAAFPDNQPLQRGQRVRVWINPLDPKKAYIADLEGLFLGTAPVLDPARADADDSSPELQRQLALRSRAIADLHRDLAPHIRAELVRRNADAERNLDALGIPDPVAPPETAAPASSMSRDDAFAALDAIAPDDRGGLAVATVAVPAAASLDDIFGGDP